MKTPLRFTVAIVTVAELCSCATDPLTGKTVFDKAKAGRIAAAVGDNLLNDAGKIAIGALAGVVSQATQGNTSKADLEQGAAEYAWKSIGTIDVAADVQNILLAAKSDPQVAAQAAATYQAIAPKTDEQKAAAVNMIATTISTAAAPSAK